MSPIAKNPLNIKLEELSDGKQKGYSAELNGPFKATIMSDSLEDLFMLIQEVINDESK